MKLNVTNNVICYLKQLFKFVQMKITKELIVVLLSNLIPVLGVFIYGWNAYDVFGLYIIETVIIGLLHMIRMAVLAKDKNLLKRNFGESTNEKAGFIVPFFFVHFMFFVFVQAILVFSPAKNSHGILSGFGYLWQLANGEGAKAVFAIFIFGLMALADDLINKRDQYRGKKLSEIMFIPYPRIFVQQFVVIIGSFFVLFSGSSKPLVVVFILVKTIADLFTMIMKQSGVKKVLDLLGVDEKDLKKS